MTVSIDIDVVGLKELEDALNELGSEVAGKKGGLVKTALMAAAKPVLDDAKANVAVKTGELRNKISRKRIPNPRAYNEVVTVGVPMPQWERGRHGQLKPGTQGRMHELGTSRQPAKPFLRPAIERNRQKSVDIFRKRLAMGIERVAKNVGNKNAAAVGARIKKL